MCCGRGLLAHAADGPDGRPARFAALVQRGWCCRVYLPNAVPPHRSKHPLAPDTAGQGEGITGLAGADVAGASSRILGHTSSEYWGRRKATASSRRQLTISLLDHWVPCGV